MLQNRTVVEQFLQKRSRRGPFSSIKPLWAGCEGHGNEGQGIGAFQDWQVKVQTTL